MEESGLAAAAVTRTQDDIVFAALELSGSGWLVAIQAADGAKPSRHWVAAGAAAAVVALLQRHGEAAARRLERGVRLVSCYEAGRDGFWLHRVLVAAGIENHVIDPSSLLVDRRARRVKTDRLDVAALLRAVMAWSGGDRRACSVVRVPTPAAEAARQPGREREALQATQRRLRNRIQSLLATQGIYDYLPERRDSAARLVALVTGDGRPLAPALVATLGRIEAQLQQLRQQQAAVEAARDAGLAVPAAAPARQLMRLKGIAGTIADGLWHEVFYRQFDNRRQVGRYVGLTGTPFASGGRSREQGIGKAGNARARRLMIEASWLWLYHQPGSALSRWYRARVGNGRGRVRRIALVALARKLLVALWRFVTTGVLPAGAMLKG